MSNSKKSRGSYYFAAALLLSCFTAIAEDTNDFHSWFVLPGLVWGAETNETRAGITAVQGVNGVTVYIDIRKQVSSDWCYIAPPDAKFSKIELQDTNGTIVTPIKGEKLDGDLPQQILLTDLPREPLRPNTRSQSPYRDELYPPAKNKLQVFSIEDAYRVEKEGDYMLTVYPVIYHCMLDKPFVSRLDLPPVTTKIHLVPTQGK